MEKKKRSEIDTMFRQVIYHARKAWLWNIKATIDEKGPLVLEDENEEDDAPYIYTMDDNHGYVYHVSFDMVKTDETFNGIELFFHVNNGDGLFEDNTWVCERLFSGLEWEELLDHIKWPED